MSDPTQPRPAYRRRSVSESDNDLMNSATSCQTYPRQLVSPGRTDSYPSISGLRTTEGSTYNRTGTRLQSQSLLSEVRIAKALDRFQRLKMEIDKWEQDLKTCFVSPDKINEQFDLLFKTTGDLAKEAILANIDLSVCGQISYYKTTLQRIKRNALTNLELHGSMDSLSPNASMDGRIRDEIDLSIGNRPRNRLQNSVHVDKQVRNTMNCSSQSGSVI